MDDASFNPVRAVFNRPPFGQDLTGEYQQRLSTFNGPGAPRMVTIGLKYRFE